MRLFLFSLLAAAAVAAERPIDPTFLYRNLDSVKARTSDETTVGCAYKPLFGHGDEQTSIVKSVARFGVLEIAPGAACNTVAYEAEEQIYYVLAGEGSVEYRGAPAPIRAGDFMYFAPTTEHGARNTSSAPLELVVMGFNVPADLEHGAPVKLPIAHESEAEKQVVGNHPPSTLYQLLLGATDSKRDLLAVGHTVVSLYLMEFTPGGTNHPHHHPNAEEIYVLLEGAGDMVAGGGADGVANHRPAKPGDAYFYRLNATVGFCADDSPGAGKAKILAVRSIYPGM